jgi:hypothetical protein
MATLNKEANFERALMNALDSLDVEVIAQFCVPGTRYRLDFFVPSVPRAAIEITNKFFLDDLARFREIQKTFAERLLVFLVWLGDGPPEDLWNEIQETAFLFFIPVVISGQSFGQVAIETAKKISDTLQVVRRNRYGDFLSAIAATSSVKAFPPTFGSSVPETASLEPIGVSDRAAEYAVPSAKTRVALLRTLKDLLPIDRYSVLEHELGQLEGEFTQGHFTSCALRVGRSLELIVYGVAKAWGVRLDDPVFNLIEDMQRQLQLINSAIFAYRESEGQERDTKRGAIQSLGSKFAGRLNDLGFLIDDQKLQASTVPPRNVEAILRDTRKTHGRLRQVRDEIQGLIDSGIVRKLLAVRNDAAHASLEGEPREVSRETVVTMMEDIQSLVHRLSVVGDIIASEGKV